MKSLTPPQGGYTSDDVLAVLQGVTGGRVDSVRAITVDNTDQPIREITSIVDGTLSIEHHALDEIHGQVAFVLQDDPITLSAYNVEVLKDNPILYYRLNEQSGTTATDFSTSALNGTYNGTAGTHYTLARASLLTSDPTDTSVFFNGSASGFVSCAHNSAFNVSNITVELMVQTTSTSAGTIAERAGHFKLEMLSTGKPQLTMYWSDATTSVYSPSSKINDGNNHHFRITYNGARVRWYVDYGVLVDSAQTKTMATVTAAWQFGKSFTGTIDEVAIYSKALTVAQQRQHYQAAIRDYSQINFGSDQLKLYYGLQMAGPAMVYLAQFNTDGDFEGWTLNSGITGAAVVNGKYNGTSTNNDAQIYDLTPFAYSGARYRYVEIGMSGTTTASSTADAIQLFWGTSAINSIDGNRVTSGPTILDGVQRVYRFDMYNAATGADQWRNNTITTMRVDPCVTTGVNFSIDYIRLVGATNETIEWPMGVYLLTTPDYQQTENGIQYDVQGYDRLVVLVDSTFTSRYTVASGTNYVTAINTILSDAGFTAPNVTATTKTLPAAMEWNTGESRLRAINDLLAAINYYALTFDENGIATSKPYVALGSRSTDWTYYVKPGATLPAELSITLPKRSYNKDYWKTPNQVTLYTGAVDTTALISTATNYSLQNLASVPNRGNLIVGAVYQVDAADQTTLDAMAQRKLDEVSQIAIKVDYPTLANPLHQHLDKIQVVDNVMNVTKSFIEYGWAIKVEAGGQMTHTLKSAEDPNA